MQRPRSWLSSAERLRPSYISLTLSKVCISCEMERQTKLRCNDIRSFFWIIKGLDVSIEGAGVNDLLRTYPETHTQFGGCSGKIG